MMARGNDLGAVSVVVSGKIDHAVAGANISLIGFGFSVDAGTTYAHSGIRRFYTVFDTKNTAFFINLDWAVLKKHIVYITYKFEVGAIISSSSNAALWLIDESNGRIVDDDVFIGKRTYRIDGTTQFFTLGYNWVLTLESSFDFSARYLTTEASNVNLDYQGLTLLASYFQRF